MITKTKSNRLIFISVQVLLLTLLGFVLVRSIPAARAADTNLTNGITVDSVLDTADASVGNGTCDDGSGICTLRAAIEEANSNADASTIEFNIAGGGIKTIQPTSPLPIITEQVTINGYSQPGASANTAVAPQPLNGTLLIELDGVNITSNSGLQFNQNSGGSAVRGLIVNNWSGGDAIQLLADNIEVQGNYIGTNAAGTIAKPNQTAVNTFGGNLNAAQNALVGGLDAADRNLLSGNTAGSSGTVGYPGNGWVIQGNYVGVAADGLTPLTNSTVGGSGSFSVDDVNDVVIGGSNPAAINVIGASLGHGIAPHATDNVRVEGNYIGLGYDGTTVLGSVGGGVGSGITFTESTNFVIKNNRIAGWSTDAMYIGADSSQGVIEDNTMSDVDHGISLGGPTDTVISGNTIDMNTGDGILALQVSRITIQNNSIQGADRGMNISSDSNAIIIDGNSVSGGSQYGIGISGTAINDVQIVGNEVNQGEVGVSVFGGAVGVLINDNDVFDNAATGVQLVNNNENIEVTNNRLYENAEDGVWVAASTGVLIEDNEIYSNGYHGIAAHSADAIFSAVSNSIYDNGELGISLAGNSPTVNDVLDPDQGANGLLNYPEYVDVAESGGDTTIQYRLDVPAGEYRIEFYENTAQDPSGHGEGEGYLGYEDVTSLGNGAQYQSKTLSGITGVENLAMTATELDGSEDGFGATSEFGTEGTPVSNTSITKTLTNAQDIAIGAVAQYQITYTNNGPMNADLSSLGTVGSGPGLFYDIVPADLGSPSGYLADGPFPGTQIINVGNPDLTCLYLPSPYPSQFGFTTDDSLASVICWFTGSDTTLEVGSSIVANIGFEVNPESNLQFTNYVLGNPAAGDPDAAEVAAAFSSGDIVDYLSESPINNFAAAAYPVPSEPDSGGSSSGGQANGSGQGILAGTGSSTLIIVGFASLLLLSAGTILSKRAQ